MFFWNRSKRPKITQSMAKGRPKAHFLSDFIGFWASFQHRFFDFLEHRFCIDFSSMFYLFSNLFSSIKPRFYCRNTAKIKVRHVQDLNISSMNFTSKIRWFLAIFRDICSLNFMFFLESFPESVFWGSKGIPGLKNAILKPFWDPKAEPESALERPFWPKWSPKWYTGEV